MNQHIQQELQTRIEAFATDVTALLTRAVAESVAAALSSSSVKRAGVERGTATPAQATKGRRPKSGRGSSLDVDTVLREVKRQGGRRAEQIAKSLRTRSKSLALPMRKLIAAKKVKTRGARRGTTYTAVI